jgi:hypothetical protein
MPRTFYPCSGCTVTEARRNATIGIFIGILIGALGVVALVAYLDSPCKYYTRHCKDRDDLYCGICKYNCTVPDKAEKCNLCQECHEADENCTHSLESLAYLGSFGLVLGAFFFLGGLLTHCFICIHESENPPDRMILHGRN